MKRIPFSETLTSLVVAFDAPGIMRSSEVEFKVPLEVDVQQSDDDVVFFAHPRRWRWLTVFDERPARLSIRYTIGGES